MTAFNVKDLAARAAQRLAEHRQKTEARGSTFSTEPLPMDRVSSLDTNSMRTMSHSEDEHRHKSKMSRLVQKVRGRFSKRLAKREVIDEPCACCLDIMPAECLISMPCQHKYCSRCLKKLVFTVMPEEGLFPPRCCKQKIPTEVILPVLTPKERTVYFAKVQEYATPARERWYCPAPTCGRFIPPKHLNSKLSSQSCPYCSTTFCSGCRCPEYNNSTSTGKKDPGFMAVFEDPRLGKAQRGLKCGSLVDLLFNCDHVTCRCKAQVCNLCRNPWLSCTCAKPGQRPIDFLTFIIGHSGVNKDQEAELAAVVAAILCNERLRDEELAKTQSGMKEKAGSANRSRASLLIPQQATRARRVS
ncbi:BRcat and Rcat domain-containing protein [Aspergillus luchuensis]|nr:IBR domain protein [Aspergillus piperis CBS 112811]XP_041542810.1 uncharacterized protein AKAW2_40730S [Aspergillus luchuensis]OJZ84195.1 hypothetical protein ASPFODRAFT_208717 [Aspergillus luchuensis CBS 106.47]GAA87234.1 IBR domain protein [Aspergillus luchuensis IFO 4308]RAH52908.1 IBR domain protein [Aspergillus piperis CBS 112811]BCR99047.1 hypothetical protein AKAW2_40730S [Aspergillus luchuensis]BCS11360.1 hypothetical protein ALUC_40700S [Aspergillus luchuensis]